MKEPRGYEYTTDLLVVGCGFSGMWAAMRAKDFLDDVLVVDKGPRDWGGLGGLSGGDMIVKQPDMNLDDLLDDLVYYYDGLADQKLLGQILTQSYDRFMDFENWGHKFVRNDKGELCFIPQRALDYMRFYYYHPYGMGGIDKARALIHRILLDKEQEEVVESRRRDCKTELQELVQRKPNQVLHYEPVSESGPDHAKVFAVAVTLNGQVVGLGSGHSKKEAEQSAARAALEQMK